MYICTYVFENVNILSTCFFTILLHYNIITELLQHNTTSGPFRKLGRLFGSCLRQNAHSPTIRLVLDQLGGYLPIGALGPSSISQLISKIYLLGPTPLVDIYYDLSYGKRPHVLLIISGPSTSSPILEVSTEYLKKANL